MKHNTAHKAGNRFLHRALAALSALLLLVMNNAFVLTAAAENDFICGLEEHTHDANCYVSQLACGQEEVAPVEGAEGEAAGHLHTESCYTMVLNCTVAEHTHTEACCAVETVEPETTEPAETEVTETEADAQPAEETVGEVVDIEEDETPLEIRTVQLYEDEQVRITVTYDDETLPAEAVMVAEAITAETDPEAYASLVEAANVALGAEVPAMFYSIGFYVGEEEVEPTAPVEVKVQFLQDSFQVDEEMTVLHLDENGAETLESQVTVAENMTEFQA